MPTHTHEAIAQLIAESPRLVDDLLRRALGVTLPPYSAVHRLDANLSETAPVEYRGDGIIVFTNAEGWNVAAFVVEVQLRPDPDKGWRWPAYLALARDRLRCDTDVFVLALDQPTTRWATRSVRLGLANEFKPLVVGAELVPRIQTLAGAREEPELAVLSAIAHATEIDAPMAVAVAIGLTQSRLEQGKLAYYIDLIRELLPKAVQDVLEAEMIPADYVPRSEFSKRLMAALAQGKAEGTAEGAAVALRNGIEALLASRGLRLSAQQTDALKSCSDTEQLQRWLLQAAHAESAESLFDNDG